MNDAINDFRVFDPVDAAAQLASVTRLMPGGARVVDLGAGGGRLALPLAAGGRSVLAVDRDEGALGHNGWSDGPRIEPLVEDFLAPGATWASQGPFEGALCLGNTAALILEHESMRVLFERVGRALAADGVFLIDDFPVWGWEAVHAGEWPAGVSEDGTAQLVWVPGEPVFAFRRNDDVDPGTPDVVVGDRLLRLWSLSELGFLANMSGFRPPRHDPAGLVLIFERASESDGTGD